jgi:hypothetical protein
VLLHWLVAAIAVLVAAAIVPHVSWALLAALVMAAASVVLEAILGVDDDDVYMLRVIRRGARRQGSQGQTDVPGIIFLEIDGLALDAGPPRRVRDFLEL